jgi:hypothetical protein
MADVSDRRIKQIQESIVQEMEDLERTIEELRAQVHPDRNTNPEVVPRPVDPSRHIGFGPTIREIDDFLQGEVLRARHKGSQNGDGLELEAKTKRKGAD